MAVMGCRVEPRAPVLSPLPIPPPTHFTNVIDVEIFSVKSPQLLLSSIKVQFDSSYPNLPLNSNTLRNNCCCLTAPKLQCQFQCQRQFRCQCRVSLPMTLSQDCINPATLQSKRTLQLFLRFLTLRYINQCFGTCGIPL